MYFDWKLPQFSVFQAAQCGQAAEAYSITVIPALGLPSVISGSRPGSDGTTSAGIFTAALVPAWAMTGAPRKDRARRAATIRRIMFYLPARRGAKASSKS